MPRGKSVHDKSRVIPHFLPSRMLLQCMEHQWKTQVTVRGFVNVIQKPLQLRGAYEVKRLCSAVEVHASNPTGQSKHMIPMHVGNEHVA